MGVLPLDPSGTVTEYRPLLNFFLWASMIWSVHTCINVHYINNITSMMSLTKKNFRRTTDLHRVIYAMEGCLFVRHARVFRNGCIHQQVYSAPVLGNVNSRSRSLYAVARPSVSLSVVCRLSVTLMHPTQSVEIFGNISMPFGTLVIRWHPRKIFTEIVPGESLRREELNTTGIAKYSDLGPIRVYISGTV